MVSQIGEFFAQIFGNGLILAIVVLFMVAMILFIFRMPAPAVIAIIAPLVLGMALVPRETGLIQFPPFVYIIVIMIMGLIFAVTVFYSLMSR